MQSSAIDAARAATGNQQQKQNTRDSQKANLSNDKALPTRMDRKACAKPANREPSVSYFEKPGWKTEEAFTLQLFIVGVSCFILGIVARWTSLIFYLVIMLSSAYMIFKQTTRKEVKERVRSVLRKDDLWHDEDFLKLAFREIPSWVNTPDWEQGNFVQKAVQQAWPAARKLIDVMMRTYVDPLLTTAKPKFLKSIKLGEINFGSQWPEIHGIKNVGTTDEERIILDIKMATYPANVSLLITAISGVGITTGLRDICVKGTFRIILAPLVGDVPFVGGIRIGFAEKPNVSFELQAGGMGLKVIPGLEDFLEDLVESLVEDYFCWPNDVLIPLLENLEPSDCVPKPKGILEITPLKARGLVHKTKVKLFHADPYCVVSIHGTEKRTKEADNTCEPTWDDVPMEFVMVDLKNSVADIVVYNAKKIGKDKNMGYCKIDFGGKWKLETGKAQKKWVKLQGTSSGEILIKITWHGYSCRKVPRSLDKDNDEGMEKTPAVAASREPVTLPSKSLMSTLARKQGLLILNIKSAQGLEARDTNGFSDPYVKIELNTAVKSKKQQKFETSVKKRTLTPSWDEEFNFKVSDYTKTVLELSVMDRDKFKSDDRLGNLSLPLIDIVKNGCKVDGWYPLQNARGKIDISAHFMYKN